jgi:DNA-binding transcriptional ArsR family regulator
VEDVETLRVLSDPLRLAILKLLMDGARRKPRVRSAKEIAAELGEPRTKLYRHLEQLQATGLIEVADTRPVSGIVEQRYRTGQLSLRVDEGFMAGKAPVDEALRTLEALWNRHRDELADAVRAGRVRLDDEGPGLGEIRPTVAIANATIAADRAQEFSARLEAIVQDFVALEDQPDGVPVNLLVSYHATGDAAPGAPVRPGG